MQNSRFKGQPLQSSVPREEFTWTFTKLKKFRLCPKRYKAVDVDKRFGTEESPALEEGNRVHEAFKRRVDSGLPMPTAFVAFNDWGDEAAKLHHPLQVTMTEKEIALNRKFETTGWMARDTWTRVKIDLLKLIPVSKTQGSFVAVVIDYKTGKPSDDLIQLAIYSAAVFAAWKSVVAVRTEYWWTQIKDKTIETFKRTDMPELWGELLPELQVMEQAHKDDNFPAKQNGLCKKHCPVWDCQFNGARKL